MVKFRKKETARETLEWVAKHGLIEHGGAMLDDLVSFLGISTTTHYEWLGMHPEYAEAVAKGREAFRHGQADVLVRSLFESAKGGFHKETTETEETHYVPRPDGENGERDVKEVVTKKTRTKKYSAPNVGAAIFLLTNIDGENWRNRQETVASGTVKVKRDDDTPVLTMDEIRSELERLGYFSEQ